MQHDNRIDYLAPINDLITRGSYREAIAELRKIESSHSAIPGTTESLEFCRTFATVFYYTGDYTAAIFYCDRAMTTGALSDLGALGKVRMIHGMSLHRIGRSSEALEKIQDAIDAFKLSGDARSQILALNNRALIMLDTGKTNHAAELFEKVARNLSRTEFPDLFMTNCVNRGYACNRLGYFQKSLEILTNPEFQDYPDPRRRAALKAELSFALMHTGKLTDATRELGALHIAAESNDLKRERILYYEYSGLRTLFLMEKPEVAMSYLDSALAFVSEIGRDSDMVSQVNRLRAEAFLQMEDYKAAKFAAITALRIAERIPERIEIGAAHRCLAIAKLKLGESDSKMHFDQSIKLFTEFTHEYELARTRKAAADSGLYPSDATRSFLALAEHYSMSEGAVLL